MWRGSNRICAIGAVFLALALAGCVRHVRHVELIGVAPVLNQRSPAPKLKLTFSSDRDFRGLHGHRVFLWTSLCPVRDDMRIDTSEVTLSGQEVQAGQDVPSRIEPSDAPLLYSAIIAYDMAFIDTDRKEAGPYRLPLPRDGLDLCFRVESTGWRRFRTNDVLIPKDQIDKALMAAPGR